MRPDEAAAIRKELEPPWNDLREQRVLGRIQEARRRRVPRRNLVIGGSLAFAVACAVLVAFALRHPVGPTTTGAGGASAMAEPGEAPAHEQRMMLADGSQALLVRDADVQIKEQNPHLVHIAQQRGQVRYEVRPDPSREFVVFAPAATVRVRGTIFTVDVESDHVEVRVERGKVEVDDGTRTRELVVGESLGIPLRPPSLTEDSGQPSEPAVSPTPSSPNGGPTFSDLLAKADDARATGRQDDAAKALQTLLATYPRDPRAPNALFTLGKVERARQHQRASAEAFDRCWRSAPNGPLAQDATAEAATSWANAGSLDAAKADARRYLDLWPDGIQATAMHAIVDR
jgi:transmembrane sensor